MFSRSTRLFRSPVKTCGLSNTIRRFLLYVFKINDRIQMEQYRLLAECLLPAHMLDWFDLQNVCVEKKDDTQVIHIYLDENEQKPDSRDGLRSWYTKVGEFGNKAFNDIAAAMYDREDEILNYFVNRSTNASAESLNAKIKQFRALLRGIVDKRFFLFRLTKIYA